MLTPHLPCLLVRLLKPYEGTRNDLCEFCEDGGQLICCEFCNVSCHPTCLPTTHAQVFNDQRLAPRAA